MPSSSRPYFGDGMPMPEVSEDTKPFWDACSEQRFLVQRCANCGLHRFPPRPVCSNCQSFSSEWTESAGVGQVFTYTVAYNTPHPVAQQEMPYNVTIVQLDDCDGVLVISNVLTSSPEELRVGLRVVLAWEDRRDGQMMYRFRPLAG
jgi:uncharacterized protein